MKLALQTELPLPPSELNPNARPSKWKKAEKVKEYRSRARWAAKASLDKDHEPLEAAAVYLEYWNRTAHRIDPDNIVAAMKSAMDGFTDAGVWVDDADTIYLPPFRSKDADHPRIMIEIYGTTIEEIHELTDWIRGKGL